MDKCNCELDCKELVTHPEITGKLCSLCYNHGCEEKPSQDYDNDYDHFRNQMRGT